MEDYGLVSVITPCYNHASYLPFAIKSVLNQSYPNWEMLIQDDCSSDKSLSIAQEFETIDPRIKVQSNTRHCGAAISRNYALRRANGKWIAFLDSDDLWKPDKLEKQLQFMVNNNYALSNHQYSEIDDEGKPIGVDVSSKKHISKFEMLTCCWPGCLTVMYDAQKVGLIQIADIKKNNDFAMWLKVIKKTDCYLLKENLAYYRRLKDSLTPTSIGAKIKWHFRLFHEAENRDIISSFVLTGCNIVGSLYKKTFYVKRQNV